MEEIKGILVVLYLIGLSVADLKRRKVSLVSLIVGMLAAVLMVGIECFAGHKGIMGICLGVIPGILMLVIGRVTQRVGYADGVVLLGIGLLYGYRVTVFLWCMSIMLMALISFILLVFKKVYRNTLMPYIPFLAISFILHGIIVQ